MQVTSPGCIAVTAGANYQQDEGSWWGRHGIDKRFYFHKFKDEIVLPYNNMATLKPFC